MKISELIKELQKYQSEYGDLEVQLEIWTTDLDTNGDDWQQGPLSEFYVEERTNVVLVSDLTA